MAQPSRVDEFDVDFETSGPFAAWRYGEIINTVSGTLVEEDQLNIKEPRSSRDLINEIQMMIADPETSSAVKSLMSSIKPLPRPLGIMNDSFKAAVSPEDVQFYAIWGMIYLNLKLSYSSKDKLKRTVDWLRNLRRMIEFCNRCLAGCGELGETRLAMVEIYRHMLTMLGENIVHLRSCATDEEALEAWPKMSTQLEEHFAAMDSTIRILNQMTTNSRTNLEQAVRHLSIRQPSSPVLEEHARFPCRRLPFLQNENFFGREKELQKITEHLEPKQDVSDLRTFTIYGKRGVGKSEIALQYAYLNPSGFDAIFWIQCETSISLRQSFTDIAVKLKLPDADENGHHEENLLAVQKWLKVTQRKWLLIYDNAERGSLLRRYWPSGAKGAVLVTSRKNYNFLKDSQRKGYTIKPLDEAQSFDLLLLLLGEDWQDQYAKHLLDESEIAAAKTLLKRTGGLMLAIQQAAVSIMNPDIGGETIAGTLEVFESNFQSLPEGPDKERLEMIRALDALWNMNFSILTPNARNLLSVLAMLSPDSTSIDLFLPKNQSALDGKLSFIYQETNIDEDGSPSSPTQPISSPTLDSAIAELVPKRLVRREKGIISVHRVVQEAMNYHSTQDLQSSFDAAVSIVHEAFPKAWTGAGLHGQWPTCQTYITHGVHLCMKYIDYTNQASRMKLESTSKFTELMANCGWYLYQIGDYETCLQLVNTASSACKDKNSTVYAHLKIAAGTCYFDMNKLKDCRRDYEIALAIQEREGENNDLKASYMLHNMGNLETACSRLEEAETYYTKAIKSRTEGGDSAAFELALTCLCMARLYYLWGTYDQSKKYLSTAEGLFVRISGSETHLMAFVNYLYGNLEFALGHWPRAKEFYDDALDIALKDTPIHFITSAIYYKLGCVELEMENYVVAKMLLDKALAIAELRSPSRDDGTITRILFKMAKVLEKDENGGQAAQDLRTRAGIAKLTLQGKGGGQILQLMDEEGNVDLNDEDDAFDSLVPIFFR